VHTEIVNEGGCLCGAVRYRVVGEPAVSMICHCNSCTRAAGSMSVAWLTYPVSAFSLLRGDLIQFHSSRHVTRRFCSSCGTPLTYVHAERASEIDVTTRSLDNPEAFPPTHHSWVSDAPSWSRPADKLPAYERSSPCV